MERFFLHDDLINMRKRFLDLLTGEKLVDVVPENGEVAGII